MKKTVVSVSCALLALVMLCACGSKPQADVSLFALKEAMLAAAPFGDMAYVSSEDADAQTYLSTVADIPFEKVDAFSISYAKDGKGNADEVVVIRVKDATDTAAALSALKTHLKTRQSLYATYDPTQSEKISQGIAFSSGLWAVMIVSDDNAAVKAAFEKAVAA